MSGEGAHVENERDGGRPDLLMPVSDEKAVHLIEIEAMRQIVDNLRRLNDRTEKQTELLHGMDQRLVRIESNKLDSAVAELAAKVDALEADRDRRVGALGLAQFVKDFGPWLLAILLGIMAFFGERTPS